jgi:hypothetical protein
LAIALAKRSAWRASSLELLAQPVEERTGDRLGVDAEGVLEDHAANRRR